MRFVHRRFAFGVVLLLSLAATSPASAGSGPALDSIRFRLDPLPGSVLGVGAATVDSARTVRGSFLLQGEHAPVLLVSDTDREDPVIRDRILGEASLAVGLGKGIQVYAGFPFVAYQSGWWPDPETSITAWGPGDLRLGGAFRVLDADRFPVGIVLRPALQVPTGMRGAFASSGVVEGLASVGLETRPGPVRIVSTLGARFRPPAEWSGMPAGSAFTYGLGIDVRLHKRWHAAAAWAGEVAGVRWDNPAELRFGGSFAAAEGVSLGAILGFGVAPGYGSPDVRFGVQLDLLKLGRSPTPQVAEGVPLDAGVAPLPVVMLPATAMVHGDGDYIEVLLATPVRFDEGETELGEEARETLTAIALYLNAHPELGRVVVLGHGDPGGGPEYNAQLTQRRAVATSKYLTDDAGVSSTLLRVPRAGEADGLIAEIDHRAERSSVSFILARSGGS
jgi:outer membrane protein OmpA-like peptidoglycan-associated protein